MGLDNDLLVNPREGGELILSVFIRVRGLKYRLVRFWRVMCAFVLRNFGYLERVNSDLEQT